MSTIDTEGGGTVAVQTKGAAETVLPCCTHIAEAAAATTTSPSFTGSAWPGCDQYAAQELPKLAIVRRLDSMTTP